MRKVLRIGFIALALGLLPAEGIAQDSSPSGCGLDVKDCPYMPL
ncbi:hypothetical protein [Thermus tengchongensis]|nr:hypothetical protein [Thermus tengchongensis]